MRNYIRLGIDLACVAVSAVLALLIRDNFIPSVPRLQALIPYVLMCVVSAAIVFTAARLHRTVWRYTSLLDVLHLIAAVTIALLLAVVAGFALYRLENVARSVPVIQWFVLIGALVGARTVVRLWRARIDKPRTSVKAPTLLQHVLVVGVNDLTELYLSSLAEFAPVNLTVVGILSRGRGLHGRLMRQYKVLGAPEDLTSVIAELELHGVSIERIVVTQRFKELSKIAQEALAEVERVSAIKVEWLLETLGWNVGESGGGTGLTITERELSPQASVYGEEPILRRGYAFVKRVIDLAAVICVGLALWPILALVALAVAIDVGLPVVFWQQRPGRHGQPFKLFKFRTMHPAHDAQGHRIPDEMRSSRIGSFLRRSRLDELPQLYNILVGEMSFVGPRPLLPVDQPQGWHAARLNARPGLTGWAQVNGGREISADDKATLDLWYITNASLWLDIRILLRTLVIVISGDRVNGMAVKVAYMGLEEIRTKPPIEAGCASSLRSEPRATPEAA